MLGVSQQLRGAHYMSHTLWTAWICWTVGFAIELIAAPARLALAGTRAGRLACRPLILPCSS